MSSDNHTTPRKPTLSNAQCKTVITTVQHCIDTINHTFTLHIPAIHVDFDLKGRVAGCFEMKNHHYRIRFNAEILVNNFQQSLQQTVPHEAAHYITYKIYGRRNIRPHGQQWREIMHILDAPAEIYHQFAVDPATIRRQQRYLYKCSCKSHELSATRHNRINRDKQSYLCRICGTELTLA